nr:unnamed protein product [Spirometra erinaceieuropaei]
MVSREDREGLAGYYRAFIPSYARLAFPLTRLTAKSRPFSWTTECENAFSHLKEALTAAPVLSFPDLSRDGPPFALDTDASSHAIGGVLSQTDTDGREHVIQLTDGYSASDLTQLAKDAALGPIRELKPGQLQHIPKAALRPVMLKDFTDSLQRIRPSLTSQSLQSYAKWNSSFGENRSAETASAASSSFLSKLFS